MLHKFADWVRTHKLTTVLIVILAFIVLRQTNNPISYQSSQGNYLMMQKSVTSTGVTSRLMPGASDQMTENSPVAPSTPQTQARMVSTNAYLSMVVKDIRQVSESIISIASKSGGYMISNSLNNPDGDGSAVIAVRVLSVKAQEVINAYKKLGVKTVSESVTGTDITDQYTNTQEHLRLLEDTKVRFESMLKASVQIQDSLNILREIQQLQYQIDALKGQEKYLADSAKYSYINVNISKDEYILPYAPDESWNAQIVFRLAVRDLIKTIRGILETVIWIGVFSIIWIPVAIIAFVIYRRFIRKML